MHHMQTNRGDSFRPANSNLFTQIDAEPVTMEKQNYGALRICLCDLGPNRLGLPPCPGPSWRKLFAILPSSVLAQALPEPLQVLYEDLELPLISRSQAATGA